MTYKLTTLAKMNVKKTRIMIEQYHNVRTYKYRATHINGCEKEQTTQ